MKLIDIAQNFGTQFIFVEDIKDIRTDCPVYKIGEYTTSQYVYVYFDCFNGIDYKFDSCSVFADKEIRILRV